MTKAINFFSLVNHEMPFPTPQKKHRTFFPIENGVEKNNVRKKLFSSSDISLKKSIFPRDICT